jgi:hypothetical protein
MFKLTNYQDHWSTWYDWSTTKEDYLIHIVVPRKPPKAQEIPMPINKLIYVTIVLVISRDLSIYLIIHVQDLHHNCPHSLMHAHVCYEELNPSLEQL